MSYIISDRQYLASVGKKAKYVPYKVRLKSCDQKDVNVAFGHPLYTFVADFTEIVPIVTCDTQENFIFPMIPDGCVSIMIFFNDDGSRGYLCGVIDEIHKITIRENEKLFIARYLPGGVRPLPKGPISNYTNHFIQLSEVLSNFEHLASVFEKSTDFSERVQFFSKALRPQYIDKRETHYVLNYCVDKIYDRNGNIKICDLSREIGFSERYIGKLFEQWVGVSPKLYAEIMRFQFSLERLELSESRPPGLLLDTALDSGFFDHAHMNRCYQRFLHCTSGALCKSGFEGLDLFKVAALIP